MIYRYGLFREPSRGWIAGVAAGLADRFGVSAGVIRLVFALIALAATPVLAVALYALLAVIMPMRPTLLDFRSEARHWRGR